MKLINNILLVLLSISILLSCTKVKNDETLKLLPMPQNVEVNWSQKHQLKNGEIDPDIILIKNVNSIPEAAINQEEAYRLIVTTDSVVIEATGDKGIYWAKQTLNQLVLQAKESDQSIPMVEITDWPAFRVRGFMHDVGRSFISVGELKKQIALLSQYKINVFHWHLTENQGWRLESRRFPQLNDSSSFTRLHDKYYTIEDAHEIAEWARKHNMMLIPEIDMPGHSEAFVRAMGVDMQSLEGTKILKELMEEICTDVFPDVEYIHIGTDEVQFTNPDFVPEMVKHIRGFDKKVISWNPGWNYEPGEIDATLLWSYRGKAQPGIPAIDSRFHYINHFDPFGDIVALYNSRIYNQVQGSDDIAGSILAIWNDRYLPTEKDIMLQNYFYPNMLAFAERTWRGGGSEYFDKNGVILPTDENDPVFIEFADFEQRLLWHKKYNFANEPFPYVKQTDVKWLITDQFPNEGDLEMSFPPEEEISDSYTYKGQNYGVKPATGAGIYLRHVWGDIVPAFYDNPQENHTAYAYTWVWSPKTQKVGLWVSTQDYSRSEADLAAPQGKWDYRGSRIWINDEELPAPEWDNIHTEKTNEISLKNENFTAREPISVELNKGWNKVLIKLPVGKFSTPEVRLQKWMFTFVFVTADGKDAMSGLIYNPSKIKK
ncbi:MAG: family 20 glycosylhydrolase [Fermentimonas sp.]|nr:family 20 glycosylhydrolase [Fermentimonas sp.]MDD2930485.1 family 20 glycosylhydrolase [Fermentimonas sp.]MDD3189628.1 family 20 glycosylhydrolase [Fermentimonas sp.]MDD3511441.1 family 20 glycosylhydrolase [Fermentimonas sp.]MDD4723397.1 family 20 glycosylhydrolase [Fermentimonas sp.]